MGLFTDTGNNDRDDEVVIDVPEEDNSGETRLGQEVEDSLVDEKGSETKSQERSSSEVSLKDIHRQNETIIDLLEQLVNDKESVSSNSSSSSRGSSRNSNRVTDRGSSKSNRVTNREDSSNDESIGDGMNELL